MEPNAKCCSNCGEIKPKVEFGRNCQTLDGLNYYCKPCAKQRYKQWAEQNPERAKATKSRYRERVRATNMLRGDPYAPSC